MEDANRNVKKMERMPNVLVKKDSNSTKMERDVIEVR